MSQTVQLPQYAWFDEKEVDFPFPDDWQITEHRIAGHDKPALSNDEIKAALDSPIGMPPLRELAKTRKEAVIIFDDMTRNTKVYEVIPHILNDLAEAGFTSDRIRFIRSTLAVYGPCGSMAMYTPLSSHVSAIARSTMRMIL